MSVELHSVTVDLPVYSAKAKSFRQSLGMTVGGRLFRRRDDAISIRALHNISMKIADGDRVALIGPNGAGKTTLLKVLAGVYTPSSGSALVNGRVSAALNVTLGLDVELSGRENIYLLAYYRGIPRATVEAAMDDIVAATELGDYLELPVHTYSAGMMGRLTFAVATAFEPDVLLMDEWLLAGDYRFITKASERVAKFVSRARVVVLASHSLEVVREFCNRAAYLRNGELVAFGPVEEIVLQYHEDAIAPAA